MPAPVYREQWFVYLVECKDTSLYCGMSNNVIKRIATHNKGRGAKYTMRRLPVKLVWLSNPFPTRSKAMSEEWRIKHLSKREKLELIYA